FLIMAPSSSGKTLIAEISIINSIIKYHKKALYLVPLRALASEKYTYFKNTYQNLDIETKMLIGDQEINQLLISQADILIITFEKFDSLLRNSQNSEWIDDINLIIIDEVHILGDMNRGPRLENLILRIYRLTTPPQIIALSATISNVDNIFDWFNYLEKKYRKKSFEIESNSNRPVELQYKIIQSNNKIGDIRKICANTLKSDGQILIFTNSRHNTEDLAQELKHIFNRQLKFSSPAIFRKELPSKNFRIEDISQNLVDIIPSGIAYHHAGLNMEERTLVERLFREKKIKILCTTNTLSAGINVPARTVILKEIMIFKPLESSSINSSKKTKYCQFPISKNLFHQICGRAGRLGYDSIGKAFILAKDIEEKLWIEDNYFKRKSYRGKVQLLPLFDELRSNLSLNRDLLSEIVLIKIFESEQFHIHNFIDFIQDSLMWHQLAEKKIPIQGLLNLQTLDFLTLLKTMGTPEQFRKLQSCEIYLNILKIHTNYLICTIKIEKLQNSEIKPVLLSDNIIVSEEKGFYSSKKPYDAKYFSSFQNKEIKRFNFPLSKYAFIFCLKAIKEKLLYQIGFPQNIHCNFNGFEQKLKNDFKNIHKIVYSSIFPKPILNELCDFDMLQVDFEDENEFHCTSLGELTIKSYILPSIAHELQFNIKKLLDIKKSLTFEKLYPIIQTVMEKFHVKRYPELWNVITLWIKEIESPEILQKVRKITNKILYIKDINSEIEEFGRYFKFITRYIESLDYYGNMENLNNLGIQIKYGIKNDIIPFAQLYHIENPKMFRALIRNGISTPKGISEIFPDQLAKILQISLEDAHFLQSSIF
ncbi:MAG: DEAD/DEAH box helicase, partial [Promethearchaeota archaeon]